jgi:hypothetical protein
MGEWQSSDEDDDSSGREGRESPDGEELSGEPSQHPESVFFVHPGGDGMPRLVEDSGSESEGEFESPGPGDSDGESLNPPGRFWEDGWRGFEEDGEGSPSLASSENGEGPPSLASSSMEDLPALVDYEADSESEGDSESERDPHMPTLMDDVDSEGGEPATSMTGLVHEADSDNEELMEENPPEGLPHARGETAQEERARILDTDARGERQTEVDIAEARMREQEAHQQHVARLQHEMARAAEAYARRENRPEVDMASDRAQEQEAHQQQLARLQHEMAGIVEADLMEEAAHQHEMARLQEEAQAIQAQIA